MTTIQHRLFDALVASFAVLALVVGLYWWGYNNGSAAGAARVQQSWDSAVRAAEKENARIRGEGYARAAELESRLKSVESRYASTNETLRSALQQRVTCPKTGVVGDIVLPADLINGMFNRHKDGNGPPGPAATKPDAAVR